MHEGLRLGPGTQRRSHPRQEFGDQASTRNRVRAPDADDDRGHRCPRRGAAACFRKRHRPPLPAPRGSHRLREPLARPRLVDGAVARAGLEPKRGRGWHSLRSQFTSDLMNQPLKVLCEVGGTRKPVRALEDGQHGAPVQGAGRSDQPPTPPPAHPPTESTSPPAPSPAGRASKTQTSSPSPC